MIYGNALGITRGSATRFLLALILLFCISPLIEDLPNGQLIESLLVTLVLIFAVTSVGGNRRTLFFACLLATPALLGRWAHHYYPQTVPSAIYLGAAVIFALFVVLHHLQFVLSAGRVDTQVLSAGISIFLMLGLLWAFGFMLLDSLVPTSFEVLDGDTPLSGFNAFYFSLAMMTGTEASTVIPHSRSARMMAVMESMVGIFYVAVFISRLVALHTAGRMPK